MKNGKVELGDLVCNITLSSWDKKYVLQKCRVRSVKYEDYPYSRNDETNINCDNLKIEATVWNHEAVEEDVFYADEAFYNRRVAGSFDIGWGFSTWYYCTPETERKLQEVVDRENDIWNNNYRNKVIIKDNDVVYKLMFDNVDKQWKIKYYGVHDVERDGHYGRFFDLDYDETPETTLLYWNHNSETATEMLEADDSLIMPNYIVKLSRKTAKRYVKWAKEKNANPSRDVPWAKVVDLSKLWPNDEVYECSKKEIEKRKERERRISNAS